MTQSQNKPELGKRIAVQGQGWSAILLVASLLRRQEIEAIEWILGSSPRLAPVTPLLATGQGPRFLQALAGEWGLELGEPVRGSFLREFRNKAFRESTWSAAPSLEARAQVIDETLWGPEKNWALPYEARFTEQDLGQVEEYLRERLLAEAATEGSRLRIRESVSTTQVNQPGEGTRITLSDGTEIAVDTFLFADRWSEIAPIKGLPRPLTFLRGREAAGILQASFRHARPIGQGVDEAFSIALPKESDEETERKVWGFFGADGLTSTWSVALSSGEAEDNQLIGKKLRRIKTALDRTFMGAWLNMDDVSAEAPVAEAAPEPEAELAPPGFTPDFLAMLRERKKKLETKPVGVTFMNLVVDEQVRFGENCLFADGAPVVHAAEIKAMPGIWFFTDGYGTSHATLQALEVARAYALLAWGSEPEAEAAHAQEGAREGLSRELERSSGSDEIVHQ
jgi:hypothetical protein